jgi:transposase-like protein
VRSSSLRSGLASTPPSGHLERVLDNLRGDPIRNGPPTMRREYAPFTPEGRARLARLIVDEGWAVRRAAERFQCSPATASRRARRYRAGLPLTDRSSRPHRQPTRSSQHLERRIIALRFTRRWGPHRIGYHLHVPRSTVGRVLARYRMPLLHHLDQATGLPVRKQPPVRYEVAAPGQLVHVDIKKLGRIPDGGGHRMLGRANGRRDRRRGMGYMFLHHAVDDHSRLAYSEQLGDERKETAAGFWRRAEAFFAQAGITVTAVITDIQAGWAAFERVRRPAGMIGAVRHPPVVVA